MELRTERVVLETPTQTITGDLQLPREGFRSRQTDYLNSTDLHFIPLVRAEILPHDSTAVGAISREFIAVARDHVLVAYPEADGDGSG